MAYYFVFIFLLIGHSETYYFTVEAQDTECFHEHAFTNNAKVYVAFEVADGGFLDVDVSVFAPDGRQLLHVNRETSGSYLIHASHIGKYTLCFNNTMSTITSKVVKFDMIVESTPEEPSDPNALQNMIADINKALHNIQKQQEYLNLRASIHHKINEASNSLVVKWSLFEVVVIMSMVLLQVYYLKSFFECRIPV